MKTIAQQKAYWSKQLSAPPPLPRLSCDKERPPVSSFVRETVTAKIPSEIWRGVQDLATGADTTTQVVLLAALQTLLFRYTGQTDLIVGTVLNPDFDSAHRRLVALRARFAGRHTALDLVRQATGAVREAGANGDLPFDTVLELLEHQPGASAESLFNVALIFQEMNDNSANSARPLEANFADNLMACALVLRAHEADNYLAFSCEYDAELFESATVERLAEHLGNLLAGMTAEPQTTLERLTLLGAAELQKLLVEWNMTETEPPKATGIHQLIEAQAQKTPDAIAAVCRDRQLTFGELNARANQVAAYLSKLGAGPDVLVGLCAERSMEMLVGLLGILKSGSAYLPLDPAYPAERLNFMIEDAQVKVLLTQERLMSMLPPGHTPRVCLDASWPLIAAEPAENVDRHVASNHLAYVIYTSGSTGRPKGVMVEHRNVLNFFAGMDARIPHGPGSTWLAATSPSFDISVLELFWTLARGFKVVIYAGDEAPATADANGELHFAKSAQTPSKRPMEFSLFYFSSDQVEGPGGAYRLLTEGARFADERGFVAVWTPERHFHEFGGLYPNPSVTSAALAMITRRVQIRSGSVVAPLHSPIRIAEEWSVVDNLSNGRVAVSFASGWMPEDFTVNLANYAQRKEIMFRHIETVRRLWHGERVPMPGPLGKEVAIKIFPRPVQKELPMWLTAAGNPETFEAAGRLGMSVLTHLLGQSIEEVSKKVAIYRRAWAQAGHAGRGHVTLMLHTFVGDDLESVKATVRAPLIEYLRKSADLIKSYAWAFSAFKQSAGSEEDVNFSTLPKEDLEPILEHAFERYFETSGLFGTPESCVKIIEHLRANDVDEVACLIDFGVNPDAVLEHLHHLDALRQAVNRQLEAGPPDYSIPALIQRHYVTHFQCTPTMAGLLLADERMQSAFARLHCLMIGGEAFPATLARQLEKIVKGELINMYGPTETTVWSTTYRVPPGSSRIPVGHPIANTNMFILDQNLSPAPIGVVGELMIGGAGVARGYLNRPDLTAQRFIQNPFNAGRADLLVGRSTQQRAPTNRLYRTGDLARYLPTGDIELLGRTDQQVKIRGHRVELGEIEAFFNEHPAVRESAVVARETASGDKRLAVYVIPRDGQNPTPRQLRQYAQEKLPEHMVPAQFVFLTAFPQTPNKKIDRQALPAPDADVVENENDFEPPATEIEEALAALWSELLEVERVGRRDNFFESGGHSLLAMQLVGRMRTRFGVDLPLKNLFEHPTVAGLAETIEALSWVAVPPRLGVRIPARADREEVAV
jgi:natural product biosynthesis luciferase-like monooxygenase protein